MKGFTLLELLLAMAIGSLIFVATFALVRDAVQVNDLAEARGREMRQHMHVRRVIRADLEALLDVEGALTVGDDELNLLCAGNVVPGWRLGPEVRVSYRWQRDEETGRFSFSRNVAPMLETESQSLQTLRLSQGINAVTVELAHDGGWADLDDRPEGPIRALRWGFDWRTVGLWRVITPVLSGTVSAPGAADRNG